MEFKKYVIIKQLIKSFNLIKKKPLNLAYPALSDLVFLLVYGFFSAVFVNRILYYLSSVYEIAVENTETFKLSFLTEGFFSAITKTPGADVFFRKFLLWVALFIFFIYLSYSFFQALSWRLSFNIAKDKRINEYMKKFFLINLFWLVFFVIYNVISFSLGLRTYIVSRYAEPTNLSVFPLIFAVIWFYFMFISYSLIEKESTLKSIKKTFLLGIKKINHFFPMYLIIFAVFYAVNYLMVYFGRINQKVVLIIGIFIVLPLFTWARLYTYLVVNHPTMNKI